MARSGICKLHARSRVLLSFVVFTHAAHAQVAKDQESAFHDIANLAPLRDFLVAEIHEGRFKPSCWYGLG